MTELDASGAELYPPSPELPNDWESFSIQINDTVYTLPVPLAAFLDDGWVISEEDAGLSLAGAGGPYASYEWEWVSLTNDHEQDISVCVFNTTESTIPVAESTVGGIHVIYGKRLCLQHHRKHDPCRREHGGRYSCNIWQLRLFR